MWQRWQRTRSFRGLCRAGAALFQANDSLAVVADHVEHTDVFVTHLLTKVCQFLSHVSEIDRKLVGSSLIQKDPEKYTEHWNSQDCQQLPNRERIHRFLIIVPRDY